MTGQLPPTSEAIHRSRLTVRLLLVVGTVAFASACKLAEVEIPLGDPVVVVHGVMRPDLPQSSYGCQFVVLEKSFTGTVDYPYDVAAAIPAGGSPKVPVDSAFVTLTNLDYSEDSCADTTVLSQLPGDLHLLDVAGVYWTPPYCPVMRAGDRLELTVRTADGETITGTTRLPGIAGSYLTVAGDSFPFVTDSAITVNRDRDTVRIHIDPVAGRLLQIEMSHEGELDMLLAYDKEPTGKLLVDTVSVALPGSLTDVFAHGEGDDLLRAGRNYFMTVSLTDSNYYDFTRSKNNRFTGRGFINHISGGVGVFGSLVSTSTRIHVVGEFDDERDGAYHLQGTVQGVDVDAILTLYAYRTTDSTEVSGFLDGTWLQLIDRVWQPWQVKDRSVDGYWENDRLLLVTYQKAIDIKPSMMRLVLRGIREADGTFGVGVADSTGLRSNTLGTLSATGPSLNR